ncbi:MAG: phosphomannomutase / phosphoglucomutase [Clostridia bacterium]|jgi:phosphomannomutase/phosphoglucomutase|nr:algC [Clostridiales bacterium]MDK2984419.1 phosphomannomutase / phosphoglucomutase [Clostridia bacterium]
MKKVNSDIFREYDIRGLTTDGSLSPEVAEQIGKAFGTVLKENNGNKAAVGYDNRFSSIFLKDFLIKGLISTGINVIDIGMVVTPMLYFAQIYYNVEGAVMVTGSHNPPEYNGFKISVNGQNLYGAGIKNLQHLIATQSFITGTGSLLKENVFPAYRNMIRKKIKLGPKKLKVVVDPGNGTTSPYAPKILSSLGCKVIPINAESNPTFPGHFPDPVLPENLEDLQAAVLKEKADVGIAYDGDGDRLGVVDNEGKIIWGDKIMILFWKEILSKTPQIDKAFVEVKCSQCLIDELKKLGVQPVFLRTGHSYVKKALKETGAPFAGEMSGHMFFADEYYGFDDAIYASARLLRILSNIENTLADELKKLPEYYSTPEIRIDCPDAIKFKIVSECKSFFSEKYSIIDVDGIRINFNDGWALIRASNTQPALVLRCEATTYNKLSQYVKIIYDKLVEYPDIKIQLNDKLFRYF